MKWQAMIVASAAAGLFAGAVEGAGNTRYLVVFKSESADATAVALVAKNGGKVDRVIPEIGVVTATGDADFAAAMGKHPDVLAVGPERMAKLARTLVVPASDADVAVAEGSPTPADNLYPRQWDIRRIHAPTAWARLETMSYPRPKVAVLDTGVMDTHPDLVGQLCTMKSTSYCNTSGGTNNTPSYPIYSTLIDFDAFPNWTPADGCTPAADMIVAHGTHVAGTVAAKFGSGRVVGVAPDACVGAYKVFDRIRFTDPVDGLVDDVGAFDGPIFAAIVDAVLEGYPVISMSLGSALQRNDQQDNASWNAWDRVAKFANRNGVLVVASAGNDAVNGNGNVAHIPSDLSTVMSTSATGTAQLVVGPTGLIDARPGSDVLAFYSNYGSPIDIAAPGGDCGPGFPATCDAPYFILNTYIFESGPNFGLPGYAFFAGTSMATPHVSAVAAYVRSLHPDWNPGAVRAFLKSTAEAIGSRQAFGHGMVDADAATR